MLVQQTEKGNTFGIALIGELDHHGARQAMEEISALYERHLPLDTELDLGGLTFMDSSGIAVILSALRHTRELGGHLHISHVPHQALKVLTAAGIDRLIPIDKEREVF